MDLPPSILSYLGPNASAALSADDPINLLFSSPATEADDSNMASKLPLTSSSSQPQPQPQPHPHPHPQMHSQPLAHVTSTPVASAPTSLSACHQPSSNQQQQQQQQQQHQHQHQQGQPQTQQQQSAQAQGQPTVGTPMEGFLDSSSAPPAHSIYDASLASHAPYGLSMLPVHASSAAGASAASVPVYSRELDRALQSFPVKLATSLPQSSPPSGAPTDSHTMPQQAARLPRQLPSSHPLLSHPHTHLGLQQALPYVSHPHAHSHPQSQIHRQHQHLQQQQLHHHHYQQQLQYGSHLAAVLPYSSTCPPTPTPPPSGPASLTHSCGTAINTSVNAPPAINPGRPAAAGAGATASATAAASTRVAKRTVKRDRSLQVMKAIASNNAPAVCLSDDELLQIGAMHESDVHLAQSRELYAALVSFKRMLAKHGYRINALHVDALQMDAAAKAFHEPFDFVLNKNAVHQQQHGKTQSQTHTHTQSLSHSQQQQQPSSSKDQHDGEKDVKQEVTQKGKVCGVEESPVSAAQSRSGMEEDRQNKIQEDEGRHFMPREDDDDDEDGGDGNDDDEIGICNRKRRLASCHSNSASTGGEVDINLADVSDGNNYALMSSGALEGASDAIQLDVKRESFSCEHKQEAAEAEAAHAVDDGDATAAGTSGGAGERPRKRARTSQKGESSTSGGNSGRLGCAVCSKQMSDGDTLVRHFRHAHQELKPFACPRCRGYYSSEGTLWHHIRNVHTETPRKYQCAHCDASYDSFGAKTRHEHATHNTASPQFVCSFRDCRRAFNFPAHLEHHAQQAHPGFRPFACDECPKSFPSANGLTRHAREVHLRPQAYSCSCSKSYSKRCHLKRHLLRVHGMSAERVQEEMNKQPHPGLLHMVPRAPPASTD